MSKPPRPIPLLPPDAVRLLQEAAQTPVTAANPLPRLIAIERATAQVQRKYPQFFRKEQ